MKKEKTKTKANIDDQEIHSVNFSAKKDSQWIRRRSRAYGNIGEKAFSRKTKNKDTHRYGNSKQKEDQKNQTSYF